MTTVEFAYCGLVWGRGWSTLPLNLPTSFLIPQIYCTLLCPRNFDNPQASISNIEDPVSIRVSLARPLNTRLPHTNEGSGDVSIEISISEQAVPRMSVGERLRTGCGKNSERNNHAVTVHETNIHLQFMLLIQQFVLARNTGPLGSPLERYAEILMWPRATPFK